MKKNLKNYGAIVLISSLAFVHYAKADETWKGFSVSNVKDENLVINGDVKLPKGATKVQAINKDVHVSLTKSSIVRGSDSGKSRLYFQVEEGRKILFCVSHDLTFRGSESDSDDKLLIVQSGSGEVEFEIKGGHSVTLDSKNKDAAGAHYCLLMEDSDEYGGTAKLRFRRKLDESSNDKDKNVEINIKRDSLLGFLSSSITFLEGDKACIQFDPTNSLDHLGRMVLRIKDKGAMVITGSRTDENEGTKIEFSDIDRSISAGQEAIVEVVNSKGPSDVAGLVVMNENDTSFEFLSDPFCALGARNDTSEYKGKFNGVRFGWVLGANGRLLIKDDAYMQYVGLSLNQKPKVKKIPGFEGVDPCQLVKLRNPSAFVVDGNNNPGSTDARIFFGDKAALFFCSGVGRDGKFRGLNNSNPFTVDAAERTTGTGNFVLDVEGPLKVFGPEDDGAAKSKIEIVSLEVAPEGGPVFPSDSGVNFPKRTFEKEDGEPLQYNCGAFFINDNMELFSTSLVHTDQCHQVFRKNSAKSEPTYVGGETFIIKAEEEFPRPRISFLNSRLHVYTDIALTGVDFVEPNLVEDDICRQNISEFIFYQNGPSADDGTGRQMILGTRIGSTAADGCSLVNCDSHLDLAQFTDCIELDFGQDKAKSQDSSNGQTLQRERGPFGPGPVIIDDTQTLQFKTAPSSPEIIENLGDTSKPSIHTIYLGCSSNISIGTDADMTGFDEDTNPCLSIQGNFFSFETQGGPLNMPSTSNITGKGGMFVDLNGKVSINSEFRASMGMMVTKSRNGIVNLPKRQIFFEPKLGIADWRLNLNDPSQQIIVPAEECLSDYTLNWINIKKDFENFCPYEISSVNLCSCPPVEEKNVISLPTIQGTVGQLQIQGSRMGDQVHIVVDGGHVRELLFLNDNYSAQAPVAAVILRNSGRIGLNTAHRNTDSLCASDTLGVNGVTIIADGEGLVDLNEDMLINNVCSILKGPNFDSENDTLTISSTVDRELRIKSGGTLDLSSFGEGTEVIFGGELFLVFEPGSCLVIGGGTVTFANDVTVLFEPSPKVEEFFAAIPFGDVDQALDPLATVPAADPHNQFASLTDYGDGLQNTDQFRVRLIGTGKLLFKDNATVRLPFDAFVGVETFQEGECEIATTDLTLELQDGAQFFVGRENFREGGILQIGNVQDLSGHSVSFTLTLNGDDAQFIIGSLGVLGLGVGVERACAVDPDDLLINTLFNVDKINFNYNNGLFDHSRIFATNDARGSLLAIGSTVGSFDVKFEEQGDTVAERRVSNFAIHGGGNVVLVEEATGAVSPFVITDDDEVEIGTDTSGDPIFSSRIRAGMLASTTLLDIVDLTGISPTQFFEAIRTLDSAVGFNDATNRANAGTIGDVFRESRTAIRAGTVANGTFVRDDVFDILGDGTPAGNRDRAVDLGGMFASVLEDAITLASSLT